MRQMRIGLCVPQGYFNEYDGWDVMHVTLRKADLERVPESRVHTALEASLNCEVHIRTI